MRKSAMLPIVCGLALVTTFVAAPDPERLVRDLGDRSGARRDAAALELAGLGAAAVPALEAVRDVADPEVRNRARALLVLAREPDEVQARRGAAADAVRAALTTRGGLDARSPLDAALASSVPDSSRLLADAARSFAVRGIVSRGLAEALARHVTPESVLSLALLVRDARIHPSSALAAARALERAFAADPASAAAVRAASAAAVAALRDARASSSPSVRRVAVALLGALLPSRDTVTLGAEADPGEGVRAEFARVLGVRAAGRGAELLRSLAADASPSVREAALLALCEVPGSPHPEPAVVAARDASAAVRAAAARLLGREATPETLPVLEGLAFDPSVRVRAAARRALATLRS